MINAHFLVQYTLQFKSLRSFRNVLVFERNLKYHQIDQKYSVVIVNVVNDYCSWKRQIFYGTSK